MAGISTKGNWALILGFSSGTGAATARKLATDREMNIIGVHRGRFDSQANQLAKEIRARGRECIEIKTDASLHENIVTACDEIFTKVGSGKICLYLHSLANASYGRFANNGPNQFHPKQFEKTFRTMAHSFVYWIQELRQRRLFAPRAQMLALGNPMTDSVVHGFGLIAASKVALEWYVRFLAKELGPEGHRVNLLKFSMVETPAIKNAFTPGDWESLCRSVKAVTPAGKLCTIEEVAECISLLTDGRFDWFNGATIDFSGGQFQSAMDVIFHPFDSPDNPDAGAVFRSEAPTFTSVGNV